MAATTRSLRGDFDVRRTRVVGGASAVRQLIGPNPDRFSIIFITSAMGGWDVSWYSMNTGENPFRIAALASLRFNFRDDGPLVCDQWLGNWTGVASDLTIIETVYRPKR